MEVLVEGGVASAWNYCVLAERVLVLSARQRTAIQRRGVLLPALWGLAVEQAENRVSFDVIADRMERAVARAAEKADDPETVCEAGWAMLPSSPLKEPLTPADVRKRVLMSQPKSDLVTMCMHFLELAMVGGASAAARARLEVIQRHLPHVMEAAGLAAGAGAGGATRGLEREMAALLDQASASSALRGTGIVTPHDLSIVSVEKQRANELFGAGKLLEALEMYQTIVGKLGGSLVKLSADEQREAKELRRATAVNSSLCLHRLGEFESAITAAKLALDLSTADAHRMKAVYRTAAAHAELAAAARDKKKAAEAKTAAAEALARAVALGLDAESADAVRRRLQTVG